MNRTHILIRTRILLPVAAGLAGLAATLGSTAHAEYLQYELKDAAISTYRVNTTDSAGGHPFDYVVSSYQTSESSKDVPLFDYPGDYASRWDGVDNPAAD